MFILGLILGVGIGVISGGLFGYFVAPLIWKP